MKSYSKKWTFESFNTKRVSYILPTKNRAKFLKKALERIKKLKKNNDELIVVDGLSSDSTREVIKSYKDIIDKYISEPDISPTQAVNKGILLASGTYIKNLTDDDIYYSRAMEKAIQIMEANPHIDILECGGIQYITALKKIRIIFRKPGINYGKSTNDIFYHGSNGVGFIIRRSALAKTGIFPSNIVSDLAFIINCIKSGANVKFCRIKLYKQIVHETNISFSPQVPKALYSLVRQFAPKKYYVLYTFDYYIRNYIVLKIIFFPLLIILNKINKMRFFVSPNNLEGNKNIVWDGGFS